MDPALRAPLSGSRVSRQGMSDELLRMVAYEVSGWPGVSKRAGRDHLNPLGA
jgi:hypothetical protein